MVAITFPAIYESIPNGQFLLGIIYNNETYSKVYFKTETYVYSWHLSTDHIFFAKDVDFFLERSMLKNAIGKELKELCKILS